MAQKQDCGERYERTAASTGKKTMEVQQAVTAQSAQSIEADSRPRRPIISTRDAGYFAARLRVSCSM